jgi:hypothetical protein
MAFNQWRGGGGGGCSKLFSTIYAGCVKSDLGGKGFMF